MFDFINMFILEYWLIFFFLFFKNLYCCNRITEVFKGTCKTPSNSGVVLLKDHEKNLANP